MVGTEFCLVRMCTIDVPEGTESLGPISLFVWKILRRNERGALNIPPSQSRASKRLDKKYEICVGMNRI